VWSYFVPRLASLWLRASIGVLVASTGRAGRYRSQQQSAPSPGRAASEGRNPSKSHAPTGRPRDRVRARVRRPRRSRAQGCARRVAPLRSHLDVAVPFGELTSPGVSACAPAGSGYGKNISTAGWAPVRRWADERRRRSARRIGPACAPIRHHKLWKITCRSLWVVQTYLGSVATRALCAQRIGDADTAACDDKTGGDGT
jgi:hypothetical protein